MTIITTLVLILMFITPIISVMTIMLRLGEARQAVNWPQVKGQVTDVRLLQSGNQYQPELDVTYTVANETYSSRQRPVSPNGQAKGSKAWAREFSLQFKPGTAVPLYYNPTQPKRATMSPKQMNASSSQTQLTSIIMIVIAVGLHLLGARGLIANFLNLSGSSVLVTMIITTIVSLLLGGALGLLVQDLRQPKT
ncbi:MAG: DUF3592 domain-containing protein [Ardenticatenaceae bacterium]|nr:DUF3592 domain-containing protein [Ardenticatenaceae bacterium]